MKATFSQDDKKGYYIFALEEFKASLYGIFVNSSIFWVIYLS